MNSRSLVNQKPIQSLLCAFVAWKALLLLVAICSPGPGYDTSTSLLFSSFQTHNVHEPLPLVLKYMSNKLTRWDAIYYVKVASRGYLWEQEWAFGWGFTRLIALCTAVTKKAGVPDYAGIEAIIAISIAHLMHLLSVLVLYKLTLIIFAGAVGTALTAASLHIISPAGLFLSSPFAESPCALFTFLGCLLFSKSFGAKGQSSLSRDLLVLVSGLFFGVATSFRSNGILSGLLLLEEFFRVLLLLPQGPQLSILRRVFFTGLGGLAVGIGLLLPQYMAYSEYCTQPSFAGKRPWCENTLPSIYGFVQDHYWNNGFFRYWTLPNVPLFLLGAPVYTMLITSGVWALRNNPLAVTGLETIKSVTLPELQELQVIRNLAVQQLLLAILTLLRGHVQIITRISSASPVMLWHLAIYINKKRDMARHAVSFMVMYAVIQGGLFASFLPPA